jgi:hypothetical protein
VPELGAGDPAEPPVEQSLAGTDQRHVSAGTARLVAVQAQVAP